VDAAAGLGRHLSLIGYKTRLIEREGGRSCNDSLLERLRSRTVAFAHDLLTIPVAWLLAYWLRFNLEEIPPDFLRVPCSRCRW
jgi:hypothetical protein